jgi:hypothetical protein
MDEFLALSSLLTGLPLTKPDPSSIEARMGRDYLRLIKEQYGAGFEALLTIYRAVTGAPDPLAAVTQNVGFKDPSVDTAARQIVFMWMLSQYGGGAGKPPDQDAGFYEKGFAWPEIKAHAVGFSHQAHGYWSNQP